MISVSQTIRFKKIQFLILFALFECRSVFLDSLQEEKWLSSSSCYGYSLLFVSLWPAYKPMQPSATLPNQKEVQVRSSRRSDVTRKVIVIRLRASFIKIAANLKIHYKNNIDSCVVEMLLWMPETHRKENCALRMHHVGHFTLSDSEPNIYTLCYSSTDLRGLRVFQHFSWKRPMSETCLKWIFFGPMRYHLQRFYCKMRCIEL